MAVNIRTVLYPHLGGGCDTPGLTVKSPSDYLSSEYEHTPLLASVAPCKYLVHLTILFSLPFTKRRNTILTSQLGGEMNESNRHKSTCSSDRGNIYIFVLLNGQILGTVSLAWPRPGETCPLWGTLGTDARSEAVC